MKLGKGKNEGREKKTVVEREIKGKEQRERKERS